MSLFPSLEVSTPMDTQSGALISPVVQRDLGCQLGNSASYVGNETVVQRGTSRKAKRVKKSKKSKKDRRVKKRTMNRKRKNRKTRTKRRVKTNLRKKKINQVGKGASYAQVVPQGVDPGTQGVIMDVEQANTGGVSHQ